VAFYKSAARKAANHDKAAAVLVQTAEVSWGGDVWGMVMGFEKWRRSWGSHDENLGFNYRMGPPNVMFVGLWGPI
jgi:hypothetical protein